MALFSRRRRNDSADHADEIPATQDGATGSDAPTGVAEDTSADAGASASSDAAASASADAGADSPGATAEVAAAPADAVPAVGISMTSFRGLGPQASVPPPAPGASAAGAAPASAVSTTAGAAFGPPAAGSPASAPHAASAPATPAQPGTAPRLRDNVVLRDALARLPEKPSHAQIIDASRQLLQGHLFLRVKGDASVLLAQGAELPLASMTIDGRRFAVAFSGGAALADSVRADGDADTTAITQPVIAVLRHMLAGPAEGILIDPASAPRRLLLPRDLVQQMLAAADEQLLLKTLLAGERAPDTQAQLVDVLTRVRSWVAVGHAGSGERLGLAEGRSNEDGSRHLLVFSHPLEVIAMERGDEPRPLTPSQLAATLRSDEGLAGVLLDPRGPWARLTRAELAPVLALP